MIIIKKSIVAIVLYSVGILLAVYVTGLRLVTFIFEIGTKTEQSDTLRNFIIFNLPDFISVIFCFGYVVFFAKKIRKINKSS